MSKDKSGNKDKSAKKEKGGKKAKDAKKRDENFNPEELAQSITQAARSMRTALSHSLAESGLYAGQDGVILALAQEGSLTPGQIAQKLGVKAPTMTRTIGRMEAQGFVERSGVEPGVLAVDEPVEALEKGVTPDGSARRA